MWEEKTAEHAYDMASTHEVDYRLPCYPDSIVDRFARWQGESGTVYTGQYVIYLEGSNFPHILNQYDTVLVKVL